MFRFFRKKTSAENTGAERKVAPTALELALQEGDHPTAITLLESEAQTAPQLNTLFMLVELKMLLEDFDGAQGDLERMLKVEPNWAMRAEIQALIWNGRVWHDRQTVPDYPVERNLLNDPSPGFFSLMLAAQFHASGQADEAKKAIASAKKQMSRVAGSLFHLSGQKVSFTHLCDTDDLTGPSLICSHADGLLDIPFEDIAEVNFPVRDNFPNSRWNPAQVITRAGQDLRVRIFAYYIGTGRHPEKEVRRLAMTVWDHDAGYQIGYGQRDLKFESAGGGIGIVGINQISRLVFHSVSAAPKEASE